MSLTEAMDIDGLREVSAPHGKNGSIRCIAVDTPVTIAVLARNPSTPNPYAYLDDAPLEERRARAVEMPGGILPESVLEEVGQAGSVSDKHKCAKEAWPDIRECGRITRPCCIR